MTKQLKNGKDRTEPGLPLVIQAFFAGCNNPVNVSNLITTLAAGNPIQVERLPVELLPHVVLLATIGLHTYSQQIVDDYRYLLQRLEETAKECDITRHLPNGEQLGWLPSLHLAFNIAQAGPYGEYDLDTLPDAGYMFQVYEHLVNTEVDELFLEVAEA